MNEGQEIVNDETQGSKHFNKNLMNKSERT